MSILGDILFVGIVVVGTAVIVEKLERCFDEKGARNE